MPIHDWTRVPAGTFHDFHATWIPLIKHALNHGVLPAGYYAMAEQSAGRIVPDVLTLKEVVPNDSRSDDAAGGTMVAVQPPRAAYSAILESSAYLAKANRIAVRHVSDDRVVAILEVVSPGNKAGDREFQKFLDKAGRMLDQGIHLLVIDLHPPTSRDPHGIHVAIWESLGGVPEQFPNGKPLTIASYVADVPVQTYVYLLAVGDALPNVPLFLSPACYVEVPLEDSYMQAVDEIPQRARSPLEK